MVYLLVVVRRLSRQEARARWGEVRLSGVGQDVVAPLLALVVAAVPVTAIWGGRRSVPEQPDPDLCRGKENTNASEQSDYQEAYRLRGNQAVCCCCVLWVPAADAARSPAPRGGGGVVHGGGVRTSKTLSSKSLDYEAQTCTAGQDRCSAVCRGAEVHHLRGPTAVVD